MFGRGKCKGSGIGRDHGASPARCARNGAALSKILRGNSRTCARVPVLGASTPVRGIKFR
jgi:hypothetical protein